jgi:hypothetical protein
VSATGTNKTYDGLTADTVTLSDNRVTGDVLTTSNTAANFADKNVGTGKTVSVIGIAITGTDSGNYTSNTTASTTANITARALTVSATGTNKTYDGLTADTVTLSDNRVSGDVLTTSNTAANFADKNVGTGKTVSVTGITLSGVDSGNYTLTSTTAGTTADITRAAIASVTGITAANKVYDATTGATLSSTGAVFNGMVGGDALNVATSTGAFADKNAGLAKTVGISGITLGGADASNYTLSSSVGSTTADIARAAIASVNGITAANKIYDGTTSASLLSGSATFAGRLGSDTLAVAGATGAFGDKNAATGKAVSISGITLGGADAANYTLTNTTGSATADITKAAITSVTGITAANKVYDATTGATLSSTGAVFNGMVGGDTLNVATSTGAFANKNAALAKSVGISGITLGGTDAANYTLASTTGSATADITKAAIASVTGITASNKVYDATTGAVLSSTGAVFNGLVGGDGLNVATSTGAFADKNAALAKTVGISGITLGGADAGNYTLSSSVGSTTADITKAAIASVTGITALNKVYDSTTGAVLATGAASFTGRLSSDVLTVASATGAFANKNAALGKTVSISSIALGGADAGNYTLSLGTANATADITRASIASITGITAADKVYDGNPGAVLATGTASFTGKFSGDSLNVAAATGSFADKNVGVAKPVAISGIVLTGADSTNYLLADATASTSASINAAALGVTATNASKTYDAAPFSGGAGVVYSGFVTGESAAVLGGTLTYGGSAQGAVNSGAYAIVPGGLSSTNYLISFIAGTLTVNPAGLTALAASITGNPTRVYDGTTNASLGATDFTLAGFLGSDNATITQTVGTYDSRHAGNRTVLVNLAASDFAAQGSTVLSNYALPVTASGAGVITAAPISVVAGMTANDKVYDGSAGATLNTGSATFAGKVAGDVLAVASAAGSFANKNAGSGKAVGITGITLGGADAADYTLVSDTATVSANITRAALANVGGITAANKVYDGATAAALISSGATFSGILGSDVLSVAAAAGEFADKSAGTGKSVSISGITLGGTDAGNYTLSSSVGGTTADITRAAIASVTGIAASNKVYDATTGAVLSSTGAVFNGMVGGDVLNVATATGAFADKNAGLAKTVGISGITLGGTDAGNYTLSSSVGSATADITRAAIASVTGVTAANKVYDGTTSASLLSGSALFAGKLGSDALSVAGATGSFGDKNAATGKAVSITGLTLAGADAGNYTLSSSVGSTTADITKAAIASVTGITVSNKVYDATTGAIFSNAGAVFNGMVGGDSLNVATSTGAFADKNAGLAKTVGISGITLGGADATNYTLTSTAASATADISKAAIASVTGIAASNKVYDATTGAVLSSTGAVFNGVVGSDVLNVATATGAFADKNAGLAKTVGISGITLGGSDAANYTLGSSLGSTTADIIRAAITSVAGITAANKVYDGTTSASLLSGSATFIGRLGSDALSVAGAAGAFADKSAGTGKSVSISGITLGGTDAGNYTLSSSVGGTTADITARSLTVSATGTNKTYNGLTADTVTLSDNRVPGDVLTTSNTAAAFVDKHVGTGKTVSVTGIAITGTDSANYTSNTTASTTADITPAALMLTATTNSKTYDGGTSALATPTASGLLGGDTIVGLTEVYADKNAGTGKTLTVNSGYVVNDGNSGGNYTVNVVNSTSGVITPAVLTITASTNSKTYDSTTSAAAPTTSGLLGTDTVTGLGAAYANKDAGTGKTLIVNSGYAVNDGNSGGNYTVNLVNSTTGVITPAMLTITASTNSKTYDSTTTAAATPTTSGLLGSDTVTGLSAAYANKDAGTGKTLIVNSGYAVNDGNSGGNYTVNLVNSTTGVITPAVLTLTAATNSKTYDSTTTAAATPTTSGLLGSDTVTGLSAAYANKDAGTGKTLIVNSGYTVNDGNSGGNYTVNLINSSSGVITPAVLTIAANPNSKIYDSTTTAAATPTASGLLGTDTVTGLTEAYANRDIGTGKTLIVNSGYTINDGNSGGNYTVNLVSNTTGVITPAVADGAPVVTNRYRDLPTAMTEISINVANLVADPNEKGAIGLYQVIRQLLPQIAAIVSVSGADGDALSNGVDYDAESGQLRFQAATALPQSLLLTGWDRKNRALRIRVWFKRG